MPTQRRSARLRQASASATPAPNGTPVKVLEAVVEQEDVVVSEKGAAITTTVEILMSTPVAPCTPASTKAKPASAKMHPAHFHHSTLPRPTQNGNLAIGLSHEEPTPTKTVAKSSPFLFRAPASGAVANLGQAAQRVRDEIAEETARIKAELMAQAAKEREENVKGRKIAQPKGRSGRFSDVHKMQFQNMDSIANHPSAFRATQTQPVTTTKGLKRTQSRAKLDEPDSTEYKKSTPAATTPHVAPFGDGPSSVKRVRQRLEDDATTYRPVSRDASSIPRPATAGKDSDSGLTKSVTLTHVMTPTKSSMARSAIMKSHSVKSKPATPVSKNIFGRSGLPRSATMKDVNKEVPVSVPSLRDGLAKVKSLWNRDRAGVSPGKSTSLAESIPEILEPFQTRTPVRTNKALPPVPLSAIGRPMAVAKGQTIRIVGDGKTRVTTPVAKSVAFVQNSPSPIKSSIPRSKTLSQIPSYSSLVAKSAKVEEEKPKDVIYPDLSSYQFGQEDNKTNSQHVDDARRELPPVNSPTTFTFRTDSTIHQATASPARFGSAAGQASLRTVRPSIAPTVGMPGAFPLSYASTIQDDTKENSDPQARSAKKPIFEWKVIEHGLPSKKRRRFEDSEEEKDDVDRQGADRGAKKQRSAPVIDEDDIFKSASRLAQPKGRFGSPMRKSPLKPSLSAVKSTPIKTPAKIGGGGISVSRLNWLSRPKNRA